MVLQKCIRKCNKLFRRAVDFADKPALKKSCAGELVGGMDLGTISDCKGYADVSGENGDYIGGVCGISLSSIRKSFAKCSLSGRKYVGGIAGSGASISDCNSMVKITECTQFFGAVAGEITGDYSGNKFVSDTLAGVDRVSYAGKTEQVSYEELCTDENLPDDYRKFTLKFVSDGKTMKEQAFSYGDSFGAEMYPEIPEKDGYYIKWDKDDLSDLHFDTVVTAEYVAYTTAIASAQKKNNRPVFIVEGDFITGDRLDAAQKTVAGTGSATESWSLIIPEDGTARHTVRWLVSDPNTDYSVYVSYDNKTEKADIVKNSSYLCFNMKGSGTVTIVPEKAPMWEVYAIGGSAAAVLIIALVTVICISHSKKKKKQRIAAGNKA